MARGTADWRIGSKLTHPYDPDLGVGVVRAIEGRYLDVFFPAADRELIIAAEGGLSRLVLQPGESAELLDSGDEVEIEAALGHEYRLSDGRVVQDADLWPHIRPDSAVERLAALRVDRLPAFRNRIDGLRLIELREAGGLGPFLGGRIELFPHQLHTALQAVNRDPVRWLLADEVGLGKTIEASLILSALVRTGRSTRAIVLAPETLTVQWLGELYRKFHQVFTLMDDERLALVESEFGEGFNPFVARRNVVVAIERLARDPALLAQALDCEPDLVVVDEAHRLCDPKLGEALGPLVRHAKHALLLTATPLQADREGFHALLDMLHPDAFESYAAFSRAVDAGEAQLPCTSSVRREDLGGLPPRVPVPIDLPARTASLDDDPRTAWIAEHAPGWRERGEKALVFVHETAALERLRLILEARTGTRATVFHQDLAVDERDIALARFRETDAPLLLCSEAGGEGRNFQFCDRMVHFDLPDDPIQLEQRIGRLDRIGRKKPVEVVYFRLAGERPDIARLYERLELFSTPSAGIDAALGGVRAAITAAVEQGSAIDDGGLEASVAEARRGKTRAATRVFYPDAYDRSMADDVLALVPPDLDQRMREYCVAAAEELGLIVQRKDGVARYYMEFGSFAKVDSLPGVGIDGLPGHVNEVRFLGTFDRQEAVENQSLAFFSSGQMLVEGLILELEDGHRGRAVLFDVPDTGLEGSGLLCIFKQGPSWTPVVVDAEGTLRPEWVEIVMASLDSAEPLETPRGGATPEWTQAVRELGAAAASGGAPGRPHAAAYFRFV
ncbi:MAG: DEAD/DEAH box helicase family protein [Deltaproteobacteria bacterium]|nr:DEAD/DEAH box helicase family protein [Deltaproteobacteria bacterium]